MVDLKEIPYELSIFLKTYSQICSTLNNISAYLDMNYINIDMVPSLQDYYYYYSIEYIKTKYKGDILRKDIEKYLREKLNLNFTQLYLWEDKVMYQ